jgi:hypothetical protein
VSAASISLCNVGTPRYVALAAASGATERIVARRAKMMAEVARIRAMPEGQLFVWERLKTHFTELANSHRRYR